MRVSTVGNPVKNLVSVIDDYADFIGHYDPSREIVRAQHLAAEGIDIGQILAKFKAVIHLYTIHSTPDGSIEITNKYEIITPHFSFIKTTHIIPVAFFFENNRYEVIISPTFTTPFLQQLKPNFYTNHAKRTIQNYPSNEQIPYDTSVAILQQHGQMCSRHKEEYDRRYEKLATRINKGREQVQEKIRAMVREYEYGVNGELKELTEWNERESEYLSQLLVSSINVPPIAQQMDFCTPVDGIPDDEW